MMGKIHTMARLKQVHQRSLKPSYKGLTKEEHRLIKLIERKEQLQKSLYGHNGFYKDCPRNKNGSVCWEELTEKEQDFFSYHNKEHEKVIDKISFMEDKYNLDQDEVSKKFNSMQSNKYGGSF